MTGMKMAKAFNEDGTVILSLYFQYLIKTMITQHRKGTASEAWSHGSDSCGDNCMDWKKSKDVNHSLWSCLALTNGDIKMIYKYVGKGDLV